MSKTEQIAIAVREIKREIAAGTYDADETYSRIVGAESEISAGAWNIATDLVIKEGVLTV